MSDIASPHNLEYIEEQYQRFRDDPDAVDPSWKTFFEGFELGMGVGGGGQGEPHQDRGQ